MFVVVPDTVSPCFRRRVSHTRKERANSEDPECSSASVVERLAGDVGVTQPSWSSGKILIGANDGYAKMKEKREPC